MILKQNATAADRYGIDVDKVRMECFREAYPRASVQVLASLTACRRIPAHTVTVDVLLRAFDGAEVLSREDTRALNHLAHSDIDVSDDVRRAAACIGLLNHTSMLPVPRDKLRRTAVSVARMSATWDGITPSQSEELALSMCANSAVGVPETSTYLDDLFDVARGHASNVVASVVSAYTLQLSCEELLDALDTASEAQNIFVADGVILSELILAAYSDGDTILEIVRLMIGEEMPFRTFRR